MKKLIFAVLLIILMLVSCGKKETIGGFVGNPVHLAAIIKSPDDTLGCTFGWVFTQTPPESNMDILSFQPDSRRYNIFFVPDVAGTYGIQYVIISPDGKVKKRNEFTCEIILDSTKIKEVDTTNMEYAEKAPAPIYESTEIPPGKKSEAFPKKTTPPPAISKTYIKGKNIPKVNGKYTIQLSSYKRYNMAERELARLSQLGIDAYIQKAVFKESGETWYRIRIGTFVSYREAKLTLNDFKKRFQNEDFWIDNVRQD